MYDICSYLRESFVSGVTIVESGMKSWSDCEELWLVKIISSRLFRKIGLVSFDTRAKVSFDEVECIALDVNGISWVWVLELMKLRLGADSGSVNLETISKIWEE